MIAERFHATDECDTLLIVWAAWMRVPEVPEGYPSASLCFQNPGYFRSVETLYDDAEDANKRNIAEAADAVIASLPLDQSWAIRHEYGFTEVYRFCNYSITLAHALEGFMAGMRKRGF
jgi:hypothetical protein